MHESSLDNMRNFRDNYLSHRWEDKLNILDLGSMDIQGSYRPLFDSPSWSYTGLDLEPGPNVDLVLHKPYKWREIPTLSADVFISGQCLEHVEFFWLTMLEIERVLKNEGLLCLLVPSGGFEHRYPVDCWRFYPDGLRALARFAGLETVTADFPVPEREYNDDSALWKDCRIIAKKTASGRRKKIENLFARWLLRHLVCR